MIELELKAMVPDPDALRTRLLVYTKGAGPSFRGRLFDRRYDRKGGLAERREVLRLRRYESIDGSQSEEICWKGPTSVSPEGFKARRELECAVSAGSIGPILEALGYRQVHAIDRYIEIYEIEKAMVRIEWYPDADVLVEIEGPPRRIENAIVVTEIPRKAFTAESLTAFATRFAERSGRPARLTLSSPDETPAHWPK